MHAQMGGHEIVFSYSIVIKRYTKANGGNKAVNGRIERFNSMKHRYLCSNRGVFQITETFHSFHWRSQNGISIGEISIGDRYKLRL